MKIFGLEIRKASTLSQPEQWLVDALNPFVAESGVSVTPESALRLSAAFACTRVLMEDIAALPKHLYIDNGQTRERATSNRLYRLVHDEPNPEMTAFSFWESMIYDCIWRQGAYAEIVRDKAGTVQELWPVPAMYVTERSNAAGKLTFHAQVPNNEPKTFTEYDMLRIPSMMYNGATGQPLFYHMRDVFGLAAALDKFCSNYFANGGHIKDFIEVPLGMKKEVADEVKRQWNEAHGKLSRLQQTAYLREGMKYEAVLIKLAELMPPELRKHQIAEVCRAFRMPLYKVAEMDRATWGNTEQMAIEYTSGTLTPWCERIEQAMNKCLLTEGEKKRGYYFECNLDGLLRGDFEGRMKGYVSGVMNGIMTINQVCARENWEPVEDGDRRLIPQNMMPLDRIDEVIDSQTTAKAAGSTPGNGRDPNAGRSLDLEPLYRDAVMRVYRRAKADVLRQAGKEAMRQDGALDAWVNTYCAEDGEQFAARSIAPVRAVSHYDDADVQANALMFRMSSDLVAMTRHASSSADFIQTLTQLFEQREAEIIESQTRWLMGVCHD